jgi:hypothetical protein
MYHQYEITGGVFSRDHEESRSFAEELGLDPERIYKDLDALIEGEKSLPENRRMQVVSILTPNHLHLPAAKKLLKNGFHVICEKPLATSYGEALRLAGAIREANRIFAVPYTYSGYPMVRQMREMVANGAVGAIQRVDVQYYQGWLNGVIHDERKRSTAWRLDPQKAGISCCIADVGTHAFHLLEYVSGLRVRRILVDLNYLYDGNRLDVDATVLLRFSEHVKGVIRCSQIASGEENNLAASIYGSGGCLQWAQENPNRLHLLEDGKPRKVLTPGNAYTSPLSRDGVKMPPGHPEGIFDAMGNIYKGVARAVTNRAYHPAEFPAVADGLRGMMFVEKAVESHENGNIWVSLDDDRASTK